MKNKKLERAIIAVTAAFVVVVLLIFFGGDLFGGKNDGIRRSDSTQMPEATGMTNEIKKGITVEQDFINTTDSISKIGIVFTRVAFREGITMNMELLEGDALLASVSLDAAAFEDQHRTYIDCGKQLTGMKNKKLTVRIYPVSEEDSGLMIMMNKDAKTTFRFGSKTIQGTLCFSVNE